MAAEGSLEEQVGRTLEQGVQMVEQIQALLKLDDRIADVLHMLNVPSKRELQLLQTRIEELSTQLDEILGKQEKATAAEPADTK